MNEKQAREIIENHHAKMPSMGMISQSQSSMRNWCPGGTNPKIRTITADNQDWVLKFCNNNNRCVPEICEREVLISLLGKAVGVPVVDAWVIPSECALPTLEQNNRKEDHVIREKVVLMPLLSGVTINKSRSQAGEILSNKAVLAANIFAFMHWVGDEDRGLEDMMLVNNEIILIDNGLCGPGPSDKIRGYHPTPEVYNYEMITKKCYGGGKRSFVAFVIRDLKLSLEKLSFPPVIGRIESLTDGAIAAFATSLLLDGYVTEKLIMRRDSLQTDYAEWLIKAIDKCNC